MDRPNIEPRSVVCGTELYLHDICIGINYYESTPRSHVKLFFVEIACLTEEITTQILICGEPSRKKVNLYNRDTLLAQLKAQFSVLN